MRIAELSRESGVSIATIKFYLREGLLHPGVLTSATQAQYDQAHVDRVALIRALMGPGNLGAAQTARVLEVIDHPPADPTSVLAAAQYAVRSHAAPAEENLAAARALISRLGWTIDDSPQNEDIAELAHALRAVDDAGILLVDGGLDRYGRWMEEIARVELATVPDAPPEAAVRQAVLGSVLIEPLMLALRRLAHQHVTVQRYGIPAEREPAEPPSGAGATASAAHSRTSPRS